MYTLRVYLHWCISVNRCNLTTDLIVIHLPRIRWSYTGVLIFSVLIVIPVRPSVSYAILAAETALVLTAHAQFSKFVSCRLSRFPYTIKGFIKNQNDYFWTKGNRFLFNNLWMSGAYSGGGHGDSPPYNHRFPTGYPVVCSYKGDWHPPFIVRYVLGDSAYAQSDFLMTPYSEAESRIDDNKCLFNIRHSSARVEMTKTFMGWWRDGFL